MVNPSLRIRNPADALGQIPADRLEMAGNRPTIITIEPKGLMNWANRTATEGRWRDNLEMIVRNGSGQYWKGNFNGHTNERSEAGIYSYGQMIKRTGGRFGDETGWGSYTIEILSFNKAQNTPTDKPTTLTAEQVAEQAPKWCPICGYKTAIRDTGVYCTRGGACDWSDYLPGVPIPRCNPSFYIPYALLEMLKAAPENEVFRTKIHSIIKQPIPAELVEYDKIIDWITWNIDPGLARLVVIPLDHRVAPERPVPEVAEAAEAPAAPTPVDVRIEPDNPNPTGEWEFSATRTEEEVGSCRYVSQLSGDGEITLDRARVVRMVTELLNQGYGWSRVIREIEALLIRVERDTDSISTDVTYDEDGNRRIEYSDHDINEVRNVNISINSDIEDEIRDILGGTDNGNLEEILDERRENE